MGCQQAFKAETLNVAATTDSERAQGFLTTLLNRLDELGPGFKRAATAAQYTHDYAGILEYISCTEKVEGCLPYPKWVDTPTTVGAVAVGLLNRLSSRATFSIPESCLLSHVDTFVTGLGSGSTSLKQHLVYLLHRLSIMGLSEFNQALVAHGIFEALEPCRSDSSRNTRFFMCKLSCALYNGNAEAKAAFSRTIGIQMLVSQALFGLRRGIHVKTRLEWLLILMKDSKGNADKEYVHEIIKHFKVHSLSRVSLPPMNAEEAEVFNELFALLNKQRAAEPSESENSR